MRRLWSALIAVLWLALPAQAVECQDVTFDGTDFTICETDARENSIRLYLRDDQGAVIGRFFRLAQIVEADGQDLLFAMNAGMYHADRSPVGYYVEDGQQEMRVVANAGPGNFGLLPNGVFCVQDGQAHVFETKRFQRRAPTCQHATQSGPMLVIDGALHPRFLVDSSSRYIRNGVGTSEDGRRVVFAISKTPVTFHHFGRLFRDHLKLPQALYLDGKVSRLYAPQIGRNDVGFALGPIVGITAPAPDS